MALDINKYRKIQNGYNVKSRREHDLIQTNINMLEHFEDTYDTDDVLINGEPRKLMVIKDTDGNTHQKKIKSPHDEPFNLGDYVEWEGKTWLIGKLDSDDKTWHRGYMYLCTKKLYWQNKNGDVISRYVYIQDATKYSSGISYTTNVFTTDNQYGIMMPTDEETKRLKRDMRFVVDFEELDEPDVHILVNRKVSLSDYTYFNRGGVITFIFTIGRFNPSTDRQFVDDNGNYYWICDYFDESKKDEVKDELLSSTDYKISGSNSLKCKSKKIFKAMSVNSEGETSIVENCSWEVVSDFDITKNISDGKIELYVSNKEHIGKSFVLNLIINSIAVVSEEITVVDIY